MEADVVSVAEVVDRVGLGVRLITRRDVGSRPVTGASVNEHSDPRPWLEGGEILMADGLGIPDDPTGQEAFVQRIDEAGVAAMALGVGPGLPFQAVPRALFKACRNRDLPLIRVPETTPFIRITDVVYSLILNTRVTDAERIVEAQRRLTRAAARPRSSGEVVTALSRLTGMWVQLRDDQERSVIAGDLPKHVTEEMVEDAIARIRDRELRGSGVVHCRRGRAQIRAVGTERLRGYLIYGSFDGKIDDAAVSLATFSASLLSIDLERQAAVKKLQQRPRNDVANRLLAGVTPAEARRLLRSVGVLAERVLVAVVHDASDPEGLHERAPRDIPEALLSRRQSNLYLILSPDVPGARERLSALADRRPAGISGAFRPHECSTAARQALQALAVARRRGGLIDAMALGNVRLLLQLGGSETLHAFSDAILGVLERAADGPRGQVLLPTLTAWFDGGCSSEVAASALKVHRHTIRHRLRRVEELTGRRLNDPRDRAELWLALEARVVAGTLDS